MPFKFLGEDITTIKCDAIVKIEDTEHGEDLSVRLVDIGDMPFKHIINISTPYLAYESDTIFKFILDCAKANDFKSIAAPYVAYVRAGYTAKPLFVASDFKVRTLIKDSDLEIFFVVPSMFMPHESDMLSENLAMYIANNYTGHERISRVFYSRRRDCSSMSAKFMQCCTDSDRLSENATPPVKYALREPTPEVSDCLVSTKRCRIQPRGVIQSGIQDVAECDLNIEGEIGHIVNMDKPFKDKLLALIDEKGIDDVECYRRANVSRQTWHKIISDKAYRPSKITVLAFSIALKLTLDETETLLKTAGFALSSSIMFDMIVQFYIEKKIYDIFRINETLYEYDQPLINC